MVEKPEQIEPGGGADTLETRLDAAGRHLRTRAELDVRHTPLAMMEIVRLKAQVRELTRWTIVLGVVAVLAAMVAGTLVFIDWPTPRPPEPEIRPNMKE